MGFVDYALNQIRCSLSVLHRSIKQNAVFYTSPHGEYPLARMDNDTVNLLKKAGNDSDRSRKTRASQACCPCRKRKVKCDLSIFGAPCHNCRIDGVECITTECRRTRRYRLQKGRHGAVAADLKLADFRQDASTPTLRIQDGALLSCFPIQMKTGPNQPSGGNAIHDKAISASCRPQPSASVSPAAVGPSPLLDETTALPQTASHGPRSSILHELAQSYTPTGAKSANLPVYILPPRRKLSDDDLQFLAHKGVFSIPDDDLRDQLLRCFILYSYPLLPVICLEDFLQALEGDGQYQISLSLFHAVMFAGCSFVDELYLHQAGFEDRQSARAFFYQKVKESAYDPILGSVLILYSFFTILIGKLTGSP